MLCNLFYILSNPKKTAGISRDELLEYVHNKTPEIHAVIRRDFPEKFEKYIAIADEFLQQIREAIAELAPEIALKCEDLQMLDQKVDTIVPWNSEVKDPYINHAVLGIVHRRYRAIVSELRRRLSETWIEQEKTEKKEEVKKEIRPIPVEELKQKVNGIFSEALNQAKEIFPMNSVDAEALVERWQSYCIRTIDEFFSQPLTDELHLIVFESFLEDAMKNPKRVEGWLSDFLRKPFADLNSELRSHLIPAQRISLEKKTLTRFQLIQQTREMIPEIEESLASTGLDQSTANFTSVSIVLAICRRISELNIEPIKTLTDLKRLNIFSASIAEKDEKCAIVFKKVAAELFAKFARQLEKPYMIRKSQLELFMDNIVDSPTAQAINKRRDHAMKSITLTPKLANVFNALGPRMIRVAMEHAARIPVVITKWSELQRYYDACIRSEEDFEKLHKDDQFKQACRIAKRSTCERLANEKSEIYKHYNLEEDAQPVSRGHILTLLRAAISASWKKSEAMLDKGFPGTHRDSSRTLEQLLKAYEFNLEQHCPESIRAMSELEPLMNELKVELSMQLLSCRQRTRPALTASSEFTNEALDGVLSRLQVSLIPDVRHESLSLKNGVTKNGKELLGTLNTKTVTQKLVNAVKTIPGQMPEKYQRQKALMDAIRQHCRSLEDQFTEIVGTYPESIPETGFRAIYKIAKNAWADFPPIQGGEEAEEAYLAVVYRVLEPVTTSLGSMLRSAERISDTSSAILPQNVNQWHGIVTRLTQRILRVISRQQRAGVRHSQELIDAISVLISQISSQDADLRRSNVTTRKITQTQNMSILAFVEKLRDHFQGEIVPALSTLKMADRNELETICRGVFDEMLQLTTVEELQSQPPSLNHIDANYREALAIFQHAQSFRQKFPGLTSEEDSLNEYFAAAKKSGNKVSWILYDQKVESVLKGGDRSPTPRGEGVNFNDPCFLVLKDGSENFKEAHPHGTSFRLFEGMGAIPTLLQSHITPSWLIATAIPNITNYEKTRAGLCIEENIGHVVIMNTLTRGKLSEGLRAVVDGVAGAAGKITSVPDLKKIIEDPGAVRSIYEYLDALCNVGPALSAGEAYLRLKAYLFGLAAILNPPKPGIGPNAGANGFIGEVRDKLRPIAVDYFETHVKSMQCIPPYPVERTPEKKESAEKCPDAPEAKNSRKTLLQKFKQGFTPTWDRADSFLSKKIPKRKKVNASLHDFTKIFNDNSPDPVTKVSSLETFVNKIRHRNKAFELSMTKEERPHAKEWASIIAKGSDDVMMAICSDIPDKDIEVATLSFAKGFTTNGVELPTRIPCGDMLRSLLDVLSNVERTMREKYKGRKNALSEILQCLQVMQDHINAINDAYPMGIDELGFRALESICKKDGDHIPLGTTGQRADFVTMLRNEFSPVFVIWERVMADTRSPMDVPEQARLPESGPFTREQVVENLIYACLRADRFCGTPGTEEYYAVWRRELVNFCPHLVTQVTDLDRITGYLLGSIQSIGWYDADQNKRTHRHINMLEFERALCEMCQKLSGETNSQAMLKTFASRPADGDGEDKAAFQQSLFAYLGSVKQQALNILPQETHKESEHFFRQAERSIGNFLKRWCPVNIGYAEKAAIFGYCVDVLVTTSYWAKRAGLTQEQHAAYTELVMTRLSSFLNKQIAHPIALVASPLQVDTPKEDQTPSYWAKYIEHVAQSCFQEFIQGCDLLKFQITDEIELQSVCQSVFTAFTVTSAILQQKVMNACRDRIPDLTTEDPPVPVLYDAVVEAILENKATLPDSIPVELSHAFFQAVDSIDVFVKTRNPAEIIKGDIVFCNPLPNPKTNLEQTLRKHLLPPETHEQIFQRGKLAIRDACAEAMVDRLVQAVAASGKETVTAPDGTTFTALSRADFSWEWLNAIQHEIGQIIASASATVPAGETPESHLTRTFTGPRGQIFLNKCGSAVEKMLLNRGVKQEICTAVRAATPDLSSSLAKKGVTTNLRERAYQQLFINRSNAALFQREKDLLTHFCLLVLVKGKNVEAQLKPRSTQIEEIAAECNEHCHAGEVCRTKDSIWPVLLTIGGETLEKRGDSPPTKLLSELPVAEHLRDLQRLVLENQQWVNTLPSADRARHVMGQLVELFEWHQQSTDYLQQSVILGADAGPSDEAMLNAQKVAEVRGSGVIKGKGAGEKPDVDGTRFRAIFRKLKEYNHTRDTGSAVSIPARISIESTAHAALASELEILEATVSGGLPIVDTEALSRDADQQEQYETYLRDQESFLAALPARASCILDRFTKLIAALEIAAEAQEKDLRTKNASEEELTTDLAKATNTRGTAVNMRDELSTRLHAAQQAHLEAKKNTEEYPLTKWKAAAVTARSAFFTTVAEALPRGTVLPDPEPWLIDLSSVKALRDVWNALEPDAKTIIGTCEDIILNRLDLEVLTTAAPDRASVLKDVKRRAKQRQKDLARIDYLKERLELIRKTIVPDPSA